MSHFEEIPLVEISRPKQWKTLSKRELKSEGYPVYGANGLIGFSDKYTHENPTIIIGCRGSCGSLHITEPESYVTGNAMALDNLDTSRIDQGFLFHFLKKRGFKDVISGSSQPQITGKGLSRVKIPVPPSTEEQHRIAAILDKADVVRRKREHSLAIVDDLIKTAYLERFGDPATNPKNLPTAPIKEFGRVITGNTPPRKNAENYGSAIEWIKSDNINTPSHSLTKAKECLSETGKQIGRIAPAGSTLVTCIAGSPNVIGNAALADRKVAFNQQINAVAPNGKTNPFFLYCQFLVGKKLIQAASTNSMKGMVSKGKFQEVVFLDPDADSQTAFGRFFEHTIKVSDRLRAAHVSSQELFDSLAWRAFRGEL